MSRSYGKVEFDAENDEWVITCEAQVSLRLKRVFERIAKNQFGILRLGATEQNSRELEWFLLRYPMEVEDSAQEELEERAEECRKKDAVVAKMLGEGYKPTSFPMALPARNYQAMAADLCLSTGRVLVADDLGLGKQQPIDAPVLTPKGYCPIGDLAIGDSVIGSAGKPVKITGVFPQGVMPSYRVTFSDKSSAEAGPEHFWAVDYYRGGRTLSRLVLTTEQLRTRPIIGSLNLQKTTLFIPMLSGPVEFETSPPLPILPYLLGQLIANGALSSHSASITSATKDWTEIEGFLQNEGVKIGAVQIYGGATRAGIPGIMPLIRHLGLDVVSAQKRIPAIFMHASPQDRISLLHGLMDADGSISKTRNRVTYSTTSKWLARDVCELIEGLGGVASISAYSRDDWKPPEFNVRVRVPLGIDPFRLSRKANKYHPLQRRRPTRSLVSVEYVRDVESVCISVDASDCLYVTENALLTHNTVTSICMLTDARTLPAVVVTLTHLPLQWKSEINKFAPHLNCHIIKKGSLYDVTVGKRGKKEPFPDVFIINYHKLKGWSEHLAPVINSVIFDECQELRRTGANGVMSQKYKAASHLSDACEFSMGLSATPIYNYGGEIFNIIDCLSKGSLGSRQEFLREWCIQSYGLGDKVKIREPKAFGMYLREQGLMLRRTRSEVGRELESLTTIPYAIDCDVDALKEVEDRAAELSKIILSQTGMAKGIKMQSAEELSNVLRQATGISKAPYVSAFVQMLVDSGERVVLYGWHRAVYDIYLAQLKKYKPAMYTGSESINQKEESRRRFVDGETDILIMSLRSGAGLDGLQYSCRTVVFGELDWSPGVHAQNIGRIHRDGQTEPVAAYFLLSEEGSDPVMADTLGIKRQQAHGIMDPKADLITKLQNDGSNARRLAEGYLKQRGIAKPKYEYEKEDPDVDEDELPTVANVRRPPLPRRRS